MWAYTGVVAILRHLVMQSCKFSSRIVRQKYAFMAFRMLTTLKLKT